MSSLVLGLQVLVCEGGGLMVWLMRGNKGLDEFVKTFLVSIGWAGWPGDAALYLDGL